MAKRRSTRRPKASPAIFRAKKSRWSQSVERRFRRVTIGRRAFISEALRGEKTLEQPPALRFTNAGRDRAAMVEGGKLQKVQHTARRARLGVAGAKHHTRQSRVHNRPGAHRARLLRDVK